MTENVQHPTHYNSHPSGVECIEIVRHMNFNVGNVIKYLWRAGLKTEQGMSDLQKELEDCEKAKFYLEDHIRQLKERAAHPGSRKPTTSEGCMGCKYLRYNKNDIPQFLCERYNNPMTEREICENCINKEL